MNYSQGGFDVGRGMGLCGWSEADQVLVRLHDVPALSYVCDQHCHTLLTCGLQRRQVPHGEHLTKRCRNWMVRREAEMGWCPEVA